MSLNTSDLILEFNYNKKDKKSELKLINKLKELSLQLDN